MSEATDQPVVVEALVAETPAGVAAETPATTTTDDDIDTEAFDRMEAPDEDDAGAGDGQPGDAPASGEAAAAGDPETIEVEVNGQKFTVPKALEGELLRQADYTKKTQELAEQRRLVDAEAATLETRRAEQAESLKAFRAEHMAIASHETAIATIDKDLAAYRTMTAQDWTDLRAADQAKYTAHADNYDFLKRTRDASTDALAAAKGDLEAKETALTASQQASRAEALTTAWKETNAVLGKQIEGWSPAKGQELGTFMVKEFGVKAEELPEVTDARIWIMADRLMRAEAENARLKTTTKQAKATDDALKTQAVTPAVKPAGGAAKPSGVRDELSTTEWLRRRNEQVRRRNASA